MGLTKSFIILVVYLEALILTLLAYVGVLVFSIHITNSMLEVYLEVHIYT